MRAPPTRWGARRTRGARGRLRDMAPAPRPARGAAAESVSFRINEGPRARPAKPFTLTYLGEGVVSVPQVGNFTRGTKAEVGAAVARAYEGLADWQVERR